MKHKIATIDADDARRAASQHLLTEGGYEAQGYASVDELIGAARAGAAPDLILMDLELPDWHDGRLRAAQRDAQLLGDIPIIALSPRATEHGDALELAGYLQTPLSAVQLYPLLNKLLVANRRVQLAQKAVEMERLRALGQLAASVVHEVDVPLSTVSGNLQFASQALARRDAHHVADELGGLDDLRTSIEYAEQGVDRAKHALQLLATFAHPEREQIAVVNVVRAIDAATRLAFLTIRDKARLVCRLVPSHYVRADEARLAQVFFNLLLNAAQAITSGGPDDNEIRIEARIVDAGLEIDVSDTGGGVDPALAERIFEPFFTTKPDGQGAGLGLGIARTIVSACGGSLELVSGQPRGATFRVTLPTAPRLAGSA